MAGRPRKPSALRIQEGNRSRTDIPPEVTLHGTPELPEGLGAVAAEHFTFLAAEFGGCGVLKRADSHALKMLADLWSFYWECRAEGKNDMALRVKARWDSAASKLGIQVIDRSKLMSSTARPADPIRSKFLRVTG